MKKTLALLALGCLLSSTALADMNAGRQVARTTQQPKMITTSSQKTYITQQETVALKKNPSLAEQAHMRRQMLLEEQRANDTANEKVYQNAVCRWADSDKYWTRAGGQSLRGLINVATCWVELPRSIHEQTVIGEPFVGTCAGIGEGCGRMSLRLASGLFDITTCLIPDFKNQLYFKDEPIIMSK